MNERRHRSRRVLSMVAAIVGLLPSVTIGCKKGAESSHPAATRPATSAASSRVLSSEPPRDLFPLNDDQVRAIVNPSGATEYTGPTAIVEGVVKVVGDPPEVGTFQKLPGVCAEAGPSYAPIYRAGDKGELADVLVALVGVQGYIRPTREDRTVKIHRCAIDPRVIDLSLGQRLMIGTDDAMPYVPQVPGRHIISRLAVKDQSPVPLMLTSPGVYAMTWLAGAPPGANVPTELIYVLPSALHQVTTIDGKFRLTGVPAGKAKITAAHLGMPDLELDLDLKPGEVRNVTLTMTYKKPVATAPSTSASIARPVVR